MGTEAATNDGAKRLRAAGTSLNAVVALLSKSGVKVTRTAVGYWRDASRLPEPMARDAMAKPPLKIPVTAWDSSGKPRPPTPPVEKGEAMPEPTQTAAALAQDWLTRISRWRNQAELTDSASQVQLAKLEMQGIKEFAALTGQEATPETTLLRSPAWTKLSAKILDALERHPEALRAVREALR